MAKFASIIPSAERAIFETTYSGLPGRFDGPADAYRHILWSADLTRRFGETAAQDILDAHEIDPPSWLPDGWAVRQSASQHAIDYHNNQLGIALGKRLPRDATWEDVVAAARGVVNEGLKHPNIVDVTLDSARPSNSNSPAWAKPTQWEGFPKSSIDEHTLSIQESNFPPVWPAIKLIDEKTNLAFADWNERTRQFEYIEKGQFIGVLPPSGVKQKEGSVELNYPNGGRAIIRQASNLEDVVSFIATPEKDGMLSQTVAANGNVTYIKTKQSGEVLRELSLDYTGKVINDSKGILIEGDRMNQKLLSELRNQFSKYDLERFSSIQISSVETSHLNEKKTVLLRDLSITANPKPGYQGQAMGGSGNDTLYGSPTQDNLSGQAGRDLLDAKAGNDHLMGGPGNDTLRGGLGRDLYYFNKGDGRDIIEDSDRKGSVMIEGIDLASTLRYAPKAHLSPYAFALPTEHITITYQPTNKELHISHGQAGDEIIIKDFKNGDLGLRFDGFPKIGESAPHRKAELDAPTQTQTAEVQTRPIAPGVLQTYERIHKDLDPKLTALGYNEEQRANIAAGLTNGIVSQMVAGRTPHIEKVDVNSYNDKVGLIANVGIRSMVAIADVADKPAQQSLEAATAQQQTLAQEHSMKQQQSMSQGGPVHSMGGRSMV